MQIYGYARVSGSDQSEDRQMIALQEQAVPKQNILVDKQSGKDFIRKNYQKLIRKMKAGDVLYIKSIDRLGRDYDEILEQWRYLTRVKDIDMIVLDFPLLDTRNQVNGVTGKFIADLVLQILSYVAQIERENTKQRQVEGIRIAKEKGVQFGRPKHDFPEQFEEIYQLWLIGEISMREGGRRLNTHHTTFARLIARYQQQKA